MATPADDRRERHDPIRQATARVLADGRGANRRFRGRYIARWAPGFGAAHLRASQRQRRGAAEAD
eukprot:625388-Pyramimonas_sp.AAC.1